MHVVFAVVWTEALDGQKQLIDRLPLRHVIANKEHAWHGFSRVNPHVSEARHGLAIVSQQDSLLLGGPIKDDGIGRLRQAGILHAHDVDFR
jgi:hypothetical protein